MAPGEGVGQDHLYRTAVLSEIAMPNTLLRIHRASHRVTDDHEEGSRNHYTTNDEEAGDNYQVVRARDSLQDFRTVPKVEEGHRNYRVDSSVAVHRTNLVGGDIPPWPDRGDDDPCVDDQVAKMDCVRPVLDPYELLKVKAGDPFRAL